MRGSDVCWVHGGAAPQVRAAGERREAVAEIRRELATLEPAEVDPITALLQQIALAHAWERYLRAEVAELDRLYYLAKRVGVDEDGDQVAVHEAKPHVLVGLWNQERDRLAKFAKLAVDAGLEQRQVELFEAQGALIADVIRRVLDDAELGLSSEQRRAAGRVAGRVLRVAS